MTKNFTKDLSDISITHHRIKSLKARENERRKFSERLADFLTFMVSLEAIILSIFVLISQNRASKVNDLREEIDLQIDIIAEQELKRLTKLLIILMEKQGIKVDEKALLEDLDKETDTANIERKLEKQV